MDTTLAFIETNASGSGLDAVRRAKELGYRVIFCASSLSYFEQLPGGSAALSEADSLLEIDTYDSASVLAELHASHIVPDGVIALDDYHLDVASAVARSFGRPHQDTHGLRTCRRKDLMRVALQSRSVEQPSFWVLEPGAAIPPTVEYPCVVKPVDDSGSVGVTICAGPKDLAAAVATVLDRSRNVRGYRLTPLCLVESFVSGEEYSVECLHVNDKWAALGMTTKVLGAAPFAVELAHAFPALLPADVYSACLDAATNWLNILGLRSGAAHVELKVDGDSIVPIEVNPRLGGNRIPQLVELATGFDCLEYVLRSAVGDSPSVPTRPMPARGGAAIRFIVADRHGELAGYAVDGNNIVRRPGVVAVELAAAPRVCHPPTSGYDYLGYVIAEGSDAIEAQAIADLAVAELRPVIEP